MNIKTYNKSYIKVEDKEVIQFYLEPMPQRSTIPFRDLSVEEIKWLQEKEDRWQSSVKTAVIQEEDKEAIENLIIETICKNTYSVHEWSLYKQQGVNIQSLDDSIFITEYPIAKRVNEFGFTASLLEETKEESQEDLFTALINVLMDSKSLNPHQDTKVLMNNFEIKRKK